MRDIKLQIRRGAKSGLLRIEANHHVISTQGDGGVQRLLIERPPEYADANMILLFTAHYKRFEAANLKQGNEFTITNALTQTDDLSLQIVFERSAVEKEHTDVIVFDLRKSNKAGEYPVDPLPSPLDDLGADVQYDAESNILHLLNRHGEQIGEGTTIQGGGESGISYGEKKITLRTADWKTGSIGTYQSIAIAPFSTAYPGAVSYQVLTGSQYDAAVKAELYVHGISTTTLTIACRGEVPTINIPIVLQYLII